MGPTLFRKHLAASPRPVPALPTAISCFGPDPKVPSEDEDRQASSPTPPPPSPSWQPPPGPPPRAWLKGRLMN